ncbi:S-adenosyl-L-methionine-dependent methyltransferase [Mucor lusitanicus]
MGNANSRPSEEVLATLSSKSRKKYNQSYPNFFESKSTASDRHSPRGSIISIRKDKRKHSSASEDSSLLNAAVSLLSSSPPSPLNTTPEYTIPIEYEIRNGRRYMISPAHRFYLPCDDEEADRIVILHFCIKYAFNGNVVAPVIQSLRVKPNHKDKYSTRVLDVGCGPGTWILEMASEFPFTEFHGIDIRTMFPTTIKPSNAKFIQHDFLQSSLPYEDNSFEFVRMRLMLQQFFHLLSEIRRILKPDGYFEILDYSTAWHSMRQILNRQIPQSLHKKLGTIDHMPSHHVSTALTLHGGFVNVHQRRIHIPIGWGGQLGEVHAQNLQSYLLSMHPDIKQELSVANEDSNANIDNLLVEAVKECTVRQSHAYWFACYGQKPAAVNNLIPTTLNTPMATAASPRDAVAAAATTTAAVATAPTCWDSIYDFVDGYID